MKRSIFLLVLVTSLVACGQTGPLYYPDSYNQDGNTQQVDDK